MTPKTNAMKKRLTLSILSVFGTAAHHPEPIRFDVVGVPTTSNAVESSRWWSVFLALSAEHDFGDRVIQLALAVDRTREDIDAGAGAAGWARFLAHLRAAVDAGEELVERGTRERTSGRGQRPTCRP